MCKHKLLSLVCGLALCVGAAAQNVEESQPGEAVERHLSDDAPAAPWLHEPKILDSEGGDEFELRDVVGEALETVKLTDVVPPIRFESGVADIPDQYVESLRKVLDEMRDRRNVRLHLVGHADDQPLSDALERVFRDNAGLSRERAGEVAEFLQRALQLPPEVVTYEWAGDSRPIASNATEQGRALNRRVEVEVWYDQAKEDVAQQEVLVANDFKKLKVCRVETLCKLRFQEGHARRARVKNLVPPLHYEDEATEVSKEFVEHIRKGLQNLSDKQNVVVKFIGYTDDAPLTGRNARIYGEHVALSKARAHRVALVVQEALGLPSAAIGSDGRGATLPLARNDTAQGRSLNRRVEVQFWHDDPLQDLPDGLQLCPVTDGTEWVTKVYDPPSGAIEPLQLAGGQPIIPAGYVDQLRRALADIGDKTNARLRFVGYTGNARLDRRTAAIYGDDVGLSAARARRAMDAISQQMGLAPAQAEHEGRGFVHSNDVVNAGFVQGEISHVVVQAVYDELAPLDDYEGVDITRVTRELKTRSPFGVNLMHITVDGQPIDDPERSSADVQRCTDLAMDKADIRFQFDNLTSRPRLSVSASPSAAKFHRLERGLFLGQPVRFSMYANYWSFIERAEVRIFRAGESVMDEPLAVVDVDASGLAEWLPVVPHLPGAGSSLQYVLRAYGRDGQFDDTRPQSLSMIHGGPDDHAAPEEMLASAEAGQLDAEGVDDMELMMADALSAEEFAEELEDWEHVAPMPEGELLAGYGESSLALQNIRLGSGTVKVQGSRIPVGHSVWVAGRRVPVDGAGNFVAEAILPSGMHTVEVAVRDEGGNETLYLRDLEFERRDGFFLGIADFTFAENRVSGPAEQLQGENPATDFDSPFDGRLAFYATQKFPEHWRLTASADTREGPVEDLFSNFLDKSPDALFRRIDPDYHYPSFGDDGAVEEIAPTLGKFYVKMSRNESHALWGNFRVGYLDNELAQVDRGLYGGNAHWEAETSTGFGEQRAALDAFVAEPGTIGGRDEFRGTGGSLYYLRNQDILAGSERVRVELRSRDSGLVTGVVNLRPVLDYDIDYLQGRIILAEPLASSEDDSALVRDSGISGDEAYLVVRYEYAPGFDEIDTLNTGGQGHYWVNDYMRLGLTASRNGEGQGVGDSDSSLDGADVTLRKSANSWLKLQAGKSEGLVSSSLYSDDGGFGFVAQDDLGFTGASAEGYRADLSVGLNDLFSGANGRIALYGQSLGAGYSAPGLATLTDVRNYGGSFRLPVGERLLFSARADKRIQELGLSSNSQELNVRVEVSERWSVSTGVRKDLREDNSPIVPLTQELGERTDAVVQVGFDSLSSFSTYAFMQDTLEKTESREDNGRMGVGGSYAFGERMRMDMEMSDGDAGAGGRLGTNYQLSDRTNLYLNYALENERTDNGLRMRRGNLVSGMKRKLGDSSSVYLEERYQDTDLMSGLTHATGVTLVAKDRWNMGANMEVGTLTDFETGAQTERRAGGLRVAYGRDKVQVSSAVEYRDDDVEQLDLSGTDRTTWLFRNNFKYQATPNWRLLGQLNHSFSDSSLGEFYGGEYTEAVLGYAYRPVTHDRLNLLAKYTYFYNLPTTDQVTLQDTAAQFIQKSHIASVDLTYDLTPSWSIGGKYARRLGELSLQREDPQFFDNTAQLYIVRTDLRVGQHWEGMLEGRVLELPDLDEQRRGALVGIYRYLGENVKAGIGYNFTDFSENLTDLSFTHEGVFINVIGSM